MKKFMMILCFLFALFYSVLCNEKSQTNQVKPGIPIGITLVLNDFVSMLNFLIRL